LNVNVVQTDESFAEIFEVKFYELPKVLKKQKSAVKISWWI